MSNYPSGYQEQQSYDDYSEEIVKQLEDLQAQNEQQKLFIASILPLIQAQHDAEHMVDGFGPKTPRPIDKALADAKLFLQDASCSEPK